MTTGHTGTTRRFVWALLAAMSGACTSSVDASDSGAPAASDVADAAGDVPGDGRATAGAPTTMYRAGLIRVGYYDVGADQSQTVYSAEFVSLQNQGCTSQGVGDWFIESCTIAGEVARLGPNAGDIHFGGTAQDDFVLHWHNPPLGYGADTENGPRWSTGGSVHVFAAGATVPAFEDTLGIPEPTTVTVTPDAATAGVPLRAGSTIHLAWPPQLGRIWVRASGVGTAGDTVRADAIVDRATGGADLPPEVVAAILALPNPRAMSLHVSAAVGLRVDTPWPMRVVALNGEFVVRLDLSGS